MNKTKIKNFSIWARRNLIEVVAYRMRFLGIDENGIKSEMEGSTDSLKLYDMGTSKPAEVSGKDISKRVRLVNHIKDHENNSDYKTAYETTVEEIAYTWFNRLIAIRFMEVNDYLPSGVRVLSSESGKREPDIVTQAAEVAEDQGFSISTDEIWQLKDENKLDELFRKMFIAQCKKLNEVLPELFDNSLDDYTELLLPISFIDDDGFIRRLVTDIDEADFNLSQQGQVEIIGWLYQYYNSEKKDTVYEAVKKNVKVSKENIAAATQLFTPDWIVRYMVENSLGRLWVDGHADTSARSDWKYYLDEAEQTPEVQIQLDKIREGRKELTPEQIRFIDPCMGSGHILVYAFDVLMQIYLSCGYTERDAAQSIVRNNLWGLDLDKRAYQLAYFAVMMKARQYDRRFLTRGIKPSLSHFQDLPAVNYSLLDEPVKSFVQQFENADTYGSLITVDNDFDIEKITEILDGSIIIEKAYQEHMILLCKILTQQYDVVCTNPPYMGMSNAELTLVDYLKKNYPDSKSDLSTAFMEKCEQLTTSTGYYAMINIPVWMFIASYEVLREKINSRNSYSSMIHFGRGVFGSDFGTTAFVISKEHISNYLAVYRRLFNKHGDVDSVETKEKWFFEGFGYYSANQERFCIIPGSPVAYWVSQTIFDTFEKGKPLGSFAYPKQGLASADNNRFLRLWHEVCFSKIDLTQTNNITPTKKKWYPHNKGGEFRKWYGNRSYVINWENNGYELKEFKGSVIRNPDYYFKEMVSYSDLTAGSYSIRYYGTGFTFDSAGPSIFNNEDFISTNYLLGIMNTNVMNSKFLNILCPTIHYTQSAVAKAPILLTENKENIDKIEKLVEKNIKLSKSDWDSFETSWDFKIHPLMVSRAEYNEQYSYNMGAKVRREHVSLISKRFELWKQDCDDRFSWLKSNEEELNRIFIDIYGLQDELTPEVDDKDVTVRKADLQREIRSFISYAVGCMFGRYSLDVEGLAYAGGEWDDSKYKTYIPDANNCIPITEEYFFEDDIVSKFADFVSAAYGADYLEENLNFIAENLGIKGNGTAREKIRKYFLTDFYKDHCKIYQKRPIYWLFDTGKKNGFKALCYMHRWNDNTVGDVRIDYMHKLQRLYRNEIIRLKENIDNGEEIAKSQKRLEKITTQLQETEEYDAKIGMVVAARTEIDLDDGVKVNYDKVQLGSDGKKYQILAAI